MSEIAVTIKLFAAYQEAFGVPELQRKFPVGTSAIAVLEALIGDRPELEAWREVTRFGINLDFAAPETILQDGDEIVFIPPVSGG